MFVNKSDKIGNVQETTEVAETVTDLCQELGIYGWWVCCAKDGENVDDGFNQLVREILRRRRKQAAETQDEGIIRLQHHNESTKQATTQSDGPDYSCRIT